MDAARAALGQEPHRRIPTNDEERRASRRDETEGGLFFGSVSFGHPKEMNP
jgi:hypothetical protein